MRYRASGILNFPQSLSRHRLGTGFPLLVGIPPDPRYARAYSNP